MRTLPRLALLTSILAAPAFAFAASFSDVPSTHPNAEAIAYVKAEGIVEGYADGTYRPDQTINRAEFLKILLEAKDAYFNAPCDEGVFPDVSPFDWFVIYTLYAKCNGIISGYPDGTFRPAANINFAEAAKIIVNTFDTPSRYEVLMPTVEPPWFAYPVSALTENNAIPFSITSPDQMITRGEMAEIIYRLKTGTTTKQSRTYWEMVGDTQVTYHEPTGVYDISFPYKISASDSHDGLRLVLSTDPQYPSVSSAFLDIQVTDSCPDGIGGRMQIGVQQTVVLGDHQFTAIEFEEGAAGTTYDTIRFTSQIGPTTCIEMSKVMGWSHVLPLDQTELAREKAQIQDVLKDVIKSIVIH